MILTSIERVKEAIKAIQGEKIDHWPDASFLDVTLPIVGKGVIPPSLF